MTGSDDAHVAARRIAEGQPFTRWLGVEIASFGEGRAVLHVVARPDLLQHRGMVHGGVIAALIDTAIAFAAGSRLGPRVLTDVVTVNFVRPAREDELLIAEAEEVHGDARRSFVKCLVLDENGDAYAAGTGTVRLSRVD